MMGCDIHISYEKFEEGEWVSIDVPVGEWNERPLGVRSYRVFRFLGGGYGPSEMKPIAELRGYPEDYEERDLEDACGAGWLLVDELVSFDYEALSGVESETYREALFDDFFEDLHALQQHGVERIVFSFWN